MRFTPVDITEMDGITPYLRHSRLIDMGFCSLFSIKDDFAPAYSVFEDMLILRMTYGEQTAYAHPLGAETDVCRMKRLLDALGGDSFIFDYIPESAVSLYEAIPGYTAHIASCDKYSDYFSTAADFTDKNRPGHPRKYTDYRSFITHFEPDVREIRPENIPDCAALFDRWCEGRDCSLCAYGCEKKLQSAIFENWNRLPVRGIIVYTGGKAQGYLMGEQNGDTALILYGKPAGRLNGLNVFMHITLIDRCFSDARFVNFSPDSGMEGLRLFKSKFTPYTMLKKYYCELKRA